VKRGGEDEEEVKGVAGRKEDVYLAGCLFGKTQTHTERWEKRCLVMSN